MKKQQLTVPLTGQILPIEQVPDPVFSEKMLGEGFAISPKEGVLYAPFTGMVKQLATTGHSITLVSEAGAEVLMHIGVDTVNLKGVGFKSQVQMNQMVQAGAPLIEFDLPYLSEAAPCSWVIFVLLNSDAFDWHLTQSSLCHVTALSASSIYLVDKNSAASEVVDKADENMVQALACVGHSNGLHARPAALVQKTAKEFLSDIEIIYESSTANAKSTLSLLMLSIPEQATVTIRAHGVDAQSAIQAMVNVLEKITDVEERIHVESFNSLISQELLPQTGTHIGVIAARGLAIGRVFQLVMDWPEFDESFSNAAHEKQRMLEAFSSVRAQLSLISSINSQDKVQKEIQAAHLNLLDDDIWHNSIVKAIEQSMPAGQAVRTCTQQLMNKLAESPLAIFRERANDLKDIGTQILYELMPCADGVQQQPVFPEHTVLIAEDLLPSVLNSDSKHNIVAMVSANGGTTSHVAIMARSLGIPFLVAMKHEVLKLQNGQEVIVDAEHGLLKENPTEQDKKEFLQRISYAKEQQKTAFATAHLPAVTADGRVIEVAANIGHADEAIQAFENGADGVGLVRTELLFMERTTMPEALEQLDYYQTIINQLKGKKAIIRTLDIGADKQLSYVNMPKEDNPSLGMRGVRLSLARSEILDAQLTALLQVKPAASCRIMLPMVSDVEEVLQVRKRLRELAQQLNITELPELGIMLEVPSAALLADQLGKHVDFFSIGTNDLTQYVLAMDRCQPELVNKLDGLHPAVLRMISYACSGAQKHEKWVGVCGALAEEVLAVPILIGLGVTELSVGALSVPQIKALVRRCTYLDCMTLVEECVQLTSAQEVRARAQVFLASIT